MRLRSWRGLAAVAVAAAISAWPTVGSAQTPRGRAVAVRSLALNHLRGQSATLASTGALGNAAARDATLVVGSIPGLLSAEVLNAVTLGWPGQVHSEASLGNLALSLGGSGITADFVSARAVAASSGPASGSSLLSKLSINGVPVAVTGQPNQTLSFPGGRVVVNEQRLSATGITVNALHARSGDLDVVIASATAGIR